MNNLLLDYIRNNVVSLKGLFGGYSNHFPNALEVSKYTRTLTGYQVFFTAPCDGYDNAIDDHEIEVDMEDILVYIWSKQ